MVCIGIKRITFNQYMYIIWHQATMNMRTFWEDKNDEEIENGYNKGDINLVK